MVKMTVGEQNARGLQPFRLQKRDNCLRVTARINNGNITVHDIHPTISRNRANFQTRNVLVHKTIVPRSRLTRYRLPHAQSNTG
jgi:hypothetical protein